MIFTLEIEMNSRVNCDKLKMNATHSKDSTINDNGIDLIIMIGVLTIIISAMIYCHSERSNRKDIQDRANRAKLRIAARGMMRV